MRTNMWKESHLQQLPETDDKSRAILQQMLIDEAHHAAVAEQSGAATLPDGVKKLMAACSTVMTTIAYRV